MNNSIMPFEFEGKSIEVVELDGKRAVSAEQIGNALEYFDGRLGVMKIFNRNFDEFENDVDYTVVALTTEAGMRETTVFYESGAVLIAMLSSQPKAKIFRRWAKKVLTAIMTQESPASSSLYLDLIETQKELINAQKELLKHKEIAQVSYVSKRWSKEESEELLEMITSGKTRREVADKLGRSYDSVRNRLNVLGGF